MANNLSFNPLESYLGLRQVHEHWGSFLALGIVLVILGTLAIIGANIATLTTILFFGALLTVGGIVQIIYAFWGRKGDGFAQNLLAGIFYTVVGILMLTHPAVTAVAITLLLAAFFTVNGIFKILVSLSAPVAQWGWLLFSGIISLALGILIWAEWPLSGLWIIGLFIGIDLLFVGWFWIMLSLESKNLATKP